MSENSFAKIAVHRSIDEKASEALLKVNSGFDGGRVSKVDFLSYLIGLAIDHLDQSTIDDIRKTYFNQVAYLQGLLKEIKQAGRSALTDAEIVKVQNLVANNSSPKVRRSRKQNKSEDTNSSDLS